MISKFLSVCTVLAATQSLAFAGEGRLDPIDVSFTQPKTVHATFKPVKKQTNRNLVGECQQIPVALTDSDFGDGAYILQAGFAQDESFGATYSVPEDAFPIRIDVMEALFGTSNAVVTTTTEWSVTIWDGTPTEGIQIASFASDDLILPHLVMPPGTNGVILSVSVDPGDPEQIYIFNDSGMNSFTVAFKIEAHHSPGDPCLTAPLENRNAFPCTDTSGLQFPNENWIDAVDGQWCVCGAGWMTFQEFPGICTPSGDWVLRASYTSVNCNVEPAACCFDDTSCQDLTPSECSIFGGTIADAGTACATYVCGSGVGACCVPATGNCVNFALDQCNTVGGVHMGEGTLCADTTCFPEGACCLADGGCIGPVSPEDCEAVAGAFQGDATVCATTDCPQPLGACCGAGWCLDTTDLDCQAVGGGWLEGEVCTDGSICDAGCIEDINGDGHINVDDLLSVVNQWGTSGGDADIDGSGTVDTEDLLAIIGAWGPCE